MSILYSTGPVENTLGIATLSVSSIVFVKILNNNENNPVEVSINVFELNGQKKNVGIAEFSIQPLSSGFATFDVSSLFQFEVQIEVQGEAAADALLSVWGKDAEGNVVAAQRVLHQELVKTGSP